MVMSFASYKLEDYYIDLLGRYFLIFFIHQKITPNIMQDSDAKSATRFMNS